MKFELVSVDVTANDAWYNVGIGSKEEKAMKSSLRRGGANALEHLHRSNLGGGLLGWATFPKTYIVNPRMTGWSVLERACLAATRSSPNSTERTGPLSYNVGDTGTHEVGHWLGLYHTFQNGCSASGDKVDDTPAEASPAFFCIPRDSCSTRPGVDPDSQLHGLFGRRLRGRAPAAAEPDAGPVRRRTGRP